MHFHQKFGTSEGSITSVSWARRRVADGDSPKRELYCPANLPNSKKPYRVAISVTVVVPGTLSRRARRAKCIRRNIKYRLGLIPSCSWQHTRNVESDTP